MKSANLIEPPNVITFTWSELKIMFHYHHDTGELTWWGPKGKPAGKNIVINGENYRSDMIVWFYYTGRFPFRYLVHHDCDETNDCIENLRDIRCRGNGAGNGCGVAKHRERWQSYISINGVNIKLGLHDTKLDAALARFTFETQCLSYPSHLYTPVCILIRQLWPEYDMINTQRGINNG